MPQPTTSESNGKLISNDDIELLCELESWDITQMKKKFHDRFSLHLKSYEETRDLILENLEKTAEKYEIEIREAKMR